MELARFVTDFATAISTVDAARPVALNQKSKKPFRPGIGPHSESATLGLVLKALASAGASYGDHRLGVSYPGQPRQKCDLCFGQPDAWEWAIEVKLLRMLGDNGNTNDNMLMHILSPYSEHRSALTDCKKLLASNLARHQAILIYGYDHPDWPLEPAIDAFERLAGGVAELGPRCSARTGPLVHPVHREAAVFGWELRGAQ